MRNYTPHVSPVDNMTSIERIHYLRDYLGGIAQSANYFFHGSSSFHLWKQPDRKISVMEKFSLKVCEAIELYTRRPEVYKDDQELRRVLKAFRKYANRYKRELFTSKRRLAEETRAAYEAQEAEAERELLKSDWYREELAREAEEKERIRLINAAVLAEWAEQDARR